MSGVLWHVEKERDMTDVVSSLHSHFVGIGYDEIYQKNTLASSFITVLRRLLIEYR